ncbi:hypothetical protein [Butyrivibrio sp.]|uniref:hypothetical protein n=1 Tax=Butyrivibrio sp. TaxID=28121 RepID=UPI0025B97B0B|nr:hypothetical protein [Butyrivibrio sp.]MBQ7430279.1 hypothetical protein [Butyrivibrio sp.]MBQ9303453.1 hypothetical protein [Butyrivibrio sp.]
MVIHDGLSSISAAIIFMIIFITIILYLLYMIAVSSAEKRKLKKARLLIEEGHRKAINGKKNDGIYQEERHIKSLEDIKTCDEIAKKIADRDLSLLS